MKEKYDKTSNCLLYFFFSVKSILKFNTLSIQPHITETAFFYLISR